MKNWILIWASVAFVLALILGTAIGLSKPGSMDSHQRQILSPSPLSQLFVTGIMQTWGEETVDAVLNVAVNWEFSSGFNIINACNLTVDRDLPVGTIAICNLSGHEHESSTGPIVGSGEIMSDSRRTVSVPVTCDPTGGGNFVQECDVQDIGGVQIIFLRTIILQVCSEFSTSGESIDGWESASCYDAPDTTRVDFSGDAVIQFSQTGAFSVNGGTIEAPAGTSSLSLAWDEFTGEITHAEWIMEGENAETVPIAVPVGSNDLRLSLSGTSAGIGLVQYEYPPGQETDPIILDAASEGNPEPNELHFTIQEKSLL